MKIIPLLFMISLMGLSACEEKGPAERMGEDIDDAVEEVSDAVQDATN
ncbi:MAG: hypothetical protein Q7W55_13080 [Pseudohongiella sp.]|nr:hypothetical protein [Pseudohongiella sp.]MDO9518811.1 hypothetical protein [Pseudohongiella sp.]MDP2128787.1 hypothetical protein [Pseudohongiella sp.]